MKKKCIAVFMAMVMTFSSLHVPVYGAEVSKNVVEVAEMSGIENIKTLSVSTERTEGDFKYVVRSDGILIVTGYTGSETNVEIPEKINGMDVAAIDGFEDCKYLIHIKLPNTVKIICDSAFKNCSSLTKIELPSGVTEVGISAFQGCSSLTKIEIPSGVTEIGKYAFQDCSNLTEVKLPFGLNIVGYGAFKNCKSLIGIEFSENLIEISNYAFSGCTSLKEVKMPKTLVLGGIKKIAGYAFENCSSLTSIEIPTGMEHLSQRTFSGCSSLTNVVLPDTITDFGNQIFYDCTSLTSIKLPEGLTYLSSSAFAGCSSLIEVELPKNLRSMGNSVFNGCSSLKSIELPESLTDISGGAFADCSSLTSIKLPEGLTIIESSTFSGCSSLAKVELPEGLTEIELYAFSDCSSLRKIELPKKLTAIDYRAFENCNNLTIHGYANSYAETFAKENNIPFQVMEEHVHSYENKVTKAATNSNDGIRTYTCTCGDSYKETIYKVASMKLSKTTYTYNGKVRQPSVTVKDSKGNKLKKNTDYTVKYSKNCKVPGQYTAKVVFKGKYSGTKTLTFCIEPKSVQLSSVKALKKGCKIVWKKGTEISGYQIQYSTSSKFTKKTTKTVTIKKIKTTSTTLKKLTAGKKYYVRVRTYKTIKVNGKSKNLYSDWSKSKKVTTKK